MSCKINRVINTEMSDIAIHSDRIGITVANGIQIAT
jgi:hypothetical protein